MLKGEKAPRLRMNPEPKDDGCLKMRLSVMGHLEPREWTKDMRLDSPTPTLSYVKMVIAMSNESDDGEELSIGDVALTRASMMCVRFCMPLPALLNKLRKLN